MSLLQQLLEDIKEHIVITPEKMIEIIETLPKEHFKHLGKYRQLIKVCELRLKNEFLKEILVKLNVSDEIKNTERLVIGDEFVGVRNMGREMDSFVFLIKIIDVPRLMPHEQTYTFTFLRDENFNNLIKNFEGWLSYTEFCKSVPGRMFKLLLVAGQGIYMNEISGEVKLFRKSS